MKKVIVTVVCAAFAAVVWNCGGKTKMLPSHHDQWLMYCDKYGVNPATPTEEQENYYLDVYVGSTEWEEDCNERTVNS